ncbi:adenylate isopentenyltransferase 5, chloroplastic [Chenopodium quinoa]|uniref:adenylate isopentenyltransferase 5, chloroplastic n=1 Tax=Chenopodium quinoa TaxID=63459 RepID=UPI000B78436A|nr:adenylate isopentenyltransferase 5, chloroplastic [Chenopodium quinoa]
MSPSYSFCKHAQTLFPGGLNSSSMNFHNNNHKDKVVVVMGATGTGKSKLSIDLAIQLQAEIINSDKIQVYKGLDIVTNKVTEEECRGVPHHMLGIIDPDVEYNAKDFRNDALLAIESIIEQDKLPIIAGGSNSFIESLVNDHPDFTSKYECCFLWVDLSLPILQCFVSERVDQMVKAGLVDEVRGIFDPEADYTQGIRRAIGVPELDSFLRAEGQNVEPEMLETLLQVAIDEIKDNTCKLACRQLQKIHRLRDFWGWNLHHIDATEVFLKQGKDAQEAWQRLVVGPSAMIVRQFLYRNTSVQSIPKTSGTTVIPSAVPIAAMATASH